MDSSKYDKKIGELLTEIDKHREKMAPILDNFLNEAEIVVSNFYKDQIEHFVVSNPDVTQNHGKEGITNLKSECRALLKQIPGIVKVKMGNDKFWSHKWTIDKLKSKSHQYPAWSTHYEELYDTRKALKESLNNTLTDLRKLLRKYGYIKEDTPYQTSYPYTYYGYIECSPKMKDCFKKYIELDKKFVKITYKLRSVESQKEKDEAKDMWDTS